MELREIVTFKFGKWAKIMGFDPILKLMAKGGGGELVKFIIFIN